MRESLETTIEVTDDQNKTNNFFQQHKLMKPRWLVMYRWRLFYARCSQVLQLCWINGHRTSFFSPCVLHRNALAS